MVLADVVNERVSRRQAADSYGVVIAADHQLDAAATEKLRGERRDEAERGAWQPPISYYRDWPVTSSEFEQLAGAPAGKEVTL